MVGPTEDLYEQIRDVALMVKIAWHEAQSRPGSSEEILDDLTREIRRLSMVVEMHLRQTTEAAQRRWNAAEKAMESAERRARTALSGIASDRIGDAFEPHGYFVYCLWGRDTERPLYVGRSENVLARLGSHFGERGKRSQVTRVTLIRCKNHRQMVNTEDRLIVEYQPPMNTLGIREEPPGHIRRLYRPRAAGS